MGYPALVVYMRHAQSEGNVMTREECFKKELPVHAYRLTERGTQQAKIAGNWLMQTYGSFDAYFCSTYARTYATLRIALPHATSVVREDSRLDEMHFGIHHFYHPFLLETHFPHELTRQARLQDYWYRPFGGENWPDGELRLHSFQHMLCRNYSGKKVLIVGHGNLFRAWRRITEDVSIGETMGTPGAIALDNCGIAEYRGVGPWYAPWNRTRLAFKSITVPWYGQSI